jgi:uncharacterized protein (TIGR03067 family)
MGLSALMVLGACFSAGADVDKDTDKEIQKFEGTWIFISIVAEGKDAAEEVVKNAKLTIQGRRFSLVYDRELHTGIITVDPSKKPKTIDVIYSSGDAKGKKSLGIYEIRNDALKVCMGVVDTARPTQFVSTPKSGHLLEVLKRAKP